MIFLVQKETFHSIVFRYFSTQRNFYYAACRVVRCCLYRHCSASDHFLFAIIRIDAHHKVCVFFRDIFHHGGTAVHGDLNDAAFR